MSVRLICPVCGTELTQQPPSWRCTWGHSFDVARQGYVNLLTVQQKHSLHPGDTRLMVAARRDFLETGCYAPIAERLQALLRSYAPHAASILDVGCGEGYYLSRLQIAERWGIDISKDAVRFAAVRDRSAHFLTATAAHLPFAEGSFHALISMFALTVAPEFHRVLQPDGIFIQVLAGEKHLSGLKSLIYPTILEKPKTLHPELQGFALLHGETIEFDFSLDSQEMIQNLLSMTPHFWRISKEAAQRLSQTCQLSDRAQVVFNVYGRQGGENLIK